MRDELRMLNRTAITVVPKKPFYDWINYIDPENPTEPDNFKEYNSYLVSMDPEGDKLIKKYYKGIFEHELWQFWTDEEQWPSNRSFKVFKEWFDYYISDMIYDLGRGNILDPEMY